MNGGNRRESENAKHSHVDLQLALNIGQDFTLLEMAQLELETSLPARSVYFHCCHSNSHATKFGACTMSKSTQKKRVFFLF